MRRPVPIASSSTASPGAAGRTAATRIAAATGLLLTLVDRDSIIRWHFRSFARKRRLPGHTRAKGVTHGRFDFEYSKFLPSMT